MGLKEKLMMSLTLNNYINRKYIGEKNHEEI